MGFLNIFDGWWIHIILLLVTLISFSYLYVARNLNHWKNKGIPCVQSTFPFGSLSNLFLQRISLTETFLELYKKTDGEKYVGFHAFLDPQLLIRDLDIVKNILVKDFSTFVDRGVYYNEEIDPLSAHLFSIEGMHWRNLRAKLSPTFTSGKMKMMYPTIKGCAEELQKYCLKLLKTDKNVDFKDITGRYGLDVITTTALGLEGNNFKDDFTDMRKITKMFSAPSTLQTIRIVLAITSRTLSNLLRLRFTPKEVENYFMRTVEQNTSYRESNNIKRNDFMQILIDLKNNKLECQQGDGLKQGNQVNLTIKEMAAQSFVFVVAGYETTSVTLGFCLYELALNPSIQDKLIAELDSVEKDLSYEVLNQLPYLEMVVNETLRKYPPVPTIQRVSSKDYTLPDGKVIEKGTLFVVSVIGLQRDPKLFPKPDEFIPERFSKENIQNIQPYSYLPFGEGPRICIGMRFGKMQVKLAIASVLSRFYVERCEKTPVPIVPERKTFTYNAEGGIWLRLRERK